MKIINTSTGINKSISEEIKIPTPGYLKVVFSPD